MVANQVPLYHLDATQTNPLPLRPKFGQILPMDSHFANCLPLCHWSATGHFSVPLGSPIAWDLDYPDYRRDSQSNKSSQIKWESGGCQVAVKWSFKWQSSGNQVVVKWRSSGNQVVVKWHSSSSQVALKWLSSGGQVVVVVIKW